MRKFISVSSCLLLLAYFSQGQKSKTTVTPVTKNESTVSYDGLKFRSIGPAITSGRIVDLAVNPLNHSEYYVGSANGGVII